MARRRVLTRRDRTGRVETRWGDLLVQSPVRIFVTLVVVAVVVEASQEALRTLVPDLPGFVEVAVGAVWLPVLLAIPLWRVVLHPLLDQHARAVEEMAAREQLLQQQAARLDFDTQLRSALEMAEDEDEVVHVASLALREGAVSLTAPADARGRGGRRRAAPRRPARIPGRGRRLRRPGCARLPGHPSRLATVFEDSEDLAVCPRLRGRNDEPARATCVPVAVLGAPVGVVHAVAPREADPPDEGRLSSVAQRVGTRLSMLRLLAEVTEQAATDPLTGLANRRRLAERFDRAVAEDTGPHALAMCDLDHFKALNDTYGHDVGDEALRTFATVLRETTRPGDLAVRFGGEEFALLLPDCPADRAVEVVDRVRDHLVEALARRPDLPPFTVSIGVADTDGAPMDLAGVIHAADEALYAAKRDGRDRVVAAA